MTTKQDLSDELNQMLGTDMDFSRMKKDDLELLVELADEGALLEPLAKYQVKEHGKQKFEEEVDNWHAGKFVTKLL